MNKNDERRVADLLGKTLEGSPAEQEKAHDELRRLTEELPAGAIEHDRYPRLERLYETGRSLLKLSARAAAMLGGSRRSPAP